MKKYVPVAFYWRNETGEPDGGPYLGQPTDEAVARVAAKGIKPVILYELQEDGGEWVSWYGGSKAPIPNYDYVRFELRFRNGEEAVCGGVPDDLASEYWWQHGGYDHDIVAYRIIDGA